MDSERYHLIKRLFQDALEREPTDRPAFLEAACGGDWPLRDEVVALLEFDEGEGVAEHALRADGGLRASLPADAETHTSKSVQPAPDEFDACSDRRRWNIPIAGGVILLVGVIATILIYRSTDRTRQPPDVQPVTDAEVTADTHQVASRRAGSTPASDATSERLDGESENRSDVFLAEEFGDVLNWARRVDDTEPEARRRLADCRRVLSDGHPATLLAMHDLAEILLRLGRAGESESLSEEAAQLAVQQFGAVHPFHLAAVAHHGRALMALGRYVDAERALLEAYEGYAEMRGPDDERAGEVADVLSRMYAEWHAVEPAQGYGYKSVHWRTKASVYTDSAPSEN